MCIPAPHASRTVMTFPSGCWRGASGIACANEAKVKAKTSDQLCHFFRSRLPLTNSRGRFHETATTPSPQGRAARRLRQGTQSQRSAKSVRLHGLNNFRNLIRTPRTFIGVLVITGLVGKDAHEQHAAAARRTRRTRKNSRRFSGDRRHTHPNKQTKNKQTQTEHDHVNLDSKSIITEPAPIRTYRSSFFSFISCET